MEQSTSGAGEFCNIFFFISRAAGGPFKNVKKCRGFKKFSLQNICAHRVTTALHPLLAQIEQNKLKHNDTPSSASHVPGGISTFLF